MVMNTMKFKPKAVLITAVLSLVFITITFRSFRSSNFSSEPPSFEIVKESVIADDELSETRADEGLVHNADLPALACQHPTLSLNNPDIDKFFQDVPPLECDKDGKDWIITYKSTAEVTTLAKSLHAPVKCTFTELLRQDEYHTVPGKTTTIDQEGVYVFTNTDYAEVVCSGKGGKTWKSYVAAPRANLTTHRKKSNPTTLHPPLNVLIWGQDSISRLMFIRKLPKTWKYMTKELHPIVLKGYNIVGDGTPQALTPMLTGKTELELPEARAEMGDKANFVDVYPFIWNEYKEKGYLTGFLEDQPTTGCFSHRHKGFNKTPTDFYMSIYFLAVDAFLYPVLTKVFSYMWPNYCIASTPTHKVMMDYFKNILIAYNNMPKFLFSFRSEQSHNDVNAIQAADGDLKDFLKDLKTIGAFNNSIVILMSDHGARFQAIRESQQGKMEERLPAWMVFLPPWFSKVYPTAYGNFRKNGDRLVTPFDIYRTLQDVHQLGSLKDEDFSMPNELTSRGMSLFREIPPSRTCKDADVEPHWCACLKEEKLRVEDELVQRAGKEVVAMINSLTDPHRSLCTPLTLSSILSAVRLIPSEELLKFRQSSDKDGRVPQMAGNTAISNMILQLTIETDPGGGHYEVTMNYDRYKGKFFVKETDISRINKYGSQADCVVHRTELSYLRKYCVCRGKEIR